MRCEAASGPTERLERDKFNKSRSGVASVVQGVRERVRGRDWGYQLGGILADFRGMVLTMDRPHVPNSIWFRTYVVSRHLLNFKDTQKRFPDPLEDVLNFFMTVGSPALASYSLQITHLNSRWLRKAFLDLEYPNSGAIPIVISAFQHVPIRVSSHPSLLPSLIVLPQNDGYWDLLLRGVEKTRRWSIPLVMGFIWVVFSILLTIIDSFYAPPSSDVGYAIVATWTYLLPLIMGWLHVGSQPEPNHLRECLDAANQLTWVATDERDSPALAGSITGRSTQAIEFMRGDVDPARKDELRTVPVFNYSRAFVWALNAHNVLSLAKNAAAKAEQRVPVDNNGPGRGAVWVVSNPGSVARENRLGTDAQVIKYCTEITTPLERVFGAPSPVSPGTPNTPAALLPLYPPPEIARKPSRWAPGIWSRVVFATLFALGLQWGTVGAAVLIHYWKPPVGFGCRAMSFLMYGVAATLAFFLCLASTILAHVSRPQHDPIYWHSWSQTYLNGGAVLCGYMGKGLAIASGIGIMVVCFFQTSGAFNNCYCASVTSDKGVHDVVFLTINYVIGPSIIKVWIGGLVLTFSAAILFGFSIYLGTPPRR